jgi:hypothetical protein
MEIYVFMGYFLSMSTRKIMKTKYNFFFICVFLLLQNCKRDEPILVQSWGNMSVEFNQDKGYFRNQIFASISTPCDDPLILINMARTDKTNYPYPTDNFIFYYLPTRKGVYRLTNYKKQPECKDVPNITDAIALYSREEGDATIQIYKILDSPKENNYLQIDEYNKDTKEIKGRFQVVFVVDSPRKLRGNYDPDTIRLTNGIFHTKILD